MILRKTLKNTFMDCLAIKREKHRLSIWSKTGFVFQTNPRMLDNLERASNANIRVDSISYSSSVPREECLRLTVSTLAKESSVLFSDIFGWRKNLFNRMIMTF